MEFDQQRMERVLDAANAAGIPLRDMQDWPLWEVFVRSQHGLAHRHVGSVHAPDAQMALLNAPWSEQKQGNEDLPASFELPKEEGR